MIEIKLTVTPNQLRSIANLLSPDEEQIAPIVPVTPQTDAAPAIQVTPPAPGSQAAHQTDTQYVLPATVEQVIIPTTGERDKRGVIWHPDFHASTKTKTTNNNWKAKKGVDKEALSMYENSFSVPQQVTPAAPGTQVTPAAPERKLATTFPELVTQINTMGISPDVASRICCSYDGINAIHDASLPQNAHLIPIISQRFYNEFGA